MNALEQNEISHHQVRIFRVFRDNPNRWYSNEAIADSAKVARRTARMHNLRLVKLGILDQAEVFPRHLYKLSSKADKRNVGYLNRLKAADEIFESTERDGRP